MVVCPLQEFHCPKLTSQLTLQCDNVLLKLQKRVIQLFGEKAKNKFYSKLLYIFYHLDVLLQMQSKSYHLKLILSKSVRYQHLVDVKRKSVLHVQSYLVKEATFALLKLCVIVNFGWLFICLWRRCKNIFIKRWLPQIQTVSLLCKMVYCSYIAQFP